MWSGCQVPVYIIVDKSEVKVFDAREKAKEDTENYAKEIIKLTADTIANNFRPKILMMVCFGKKKIMRRAFKFEKSASRDLITGLKRVYNRFSKRSRS